MVMQSLVYFKALADETRLRLLSLLSRREFNVAELMEILDMGQSRISRHLRVLADSGLVRARKDGLWTFYTVAQEEAGRRFLGAVGYLLAGEPFGADRERAAEVTAAGRRRKRRFFDALAEDWEEMKRSIIGSLDLGREISASLPACRAAADLGCGTGDLLPLLAQRAEKVIGVDSSPRMLALARQRFAAAGSAGPELRLGELEHLPLRDGEVDYAVISMVLHHLPDPPAGLAEACRVCRRGLILVELDRHRDESLRRRFGDYWLGFTRPQLETWLPAAGFRVSAPRTYALEKNLTALLYAAHKLEGESDETERT
jgi:ubiquinone/menaquinone biosynthesis C-methylase UbiE